MPVAERTPKALIGLIGVAALAISLVAPTTSATAGIVAPPAKCEGQKNVKAPESRQEEAMRCLINHARQHQGAGGVGSHRALERAAGRKAGDVMHCGFSHTACGHPADLYPRRFGYTSGSFAWGENLGWGQGKRGSARNVLEAWLNSPPHRETMLRGSFDDFGLGLRRGGFDGHDNAAVWVLQIGCRGC